MWGSKLIKIKCDKCGRPCKVWDDEVYLCGICARAYFDHFR